MTAPAAPVISVRNNGVTVRLRFPLVAGAATYRVYEAATTAPTTLLLTGQTTSDLTFVPLNNPAYIRATAVNAGAEESAYSNEVVVWSPDSGRTITTSDPFGGYDRRDR